MDLGISNRRAIVCAASRGIGRAVAFSLAREGVRVSLVARDAAQLSATASDIARTTGADVEFVVADLTSPADRHRLIKTRPGPDILIVNPGVPQRSASFETMLREQRDWWMEAHFYSMIELIQAYLPGMIERRFGRIVNVSVSFIKFPQVNAGHSHAARLALAGAIAALVREAVPHDVTINSVLPGLIDTEALQASLSQRARDRDCTYDEIAADVLKRCPAGRMAAPEEVGDLVAMLCSAQSGFMTGQNIVIDGGTYQGLF